MCHVFFRIFETVEKKKAVQKFIKPQEILCCITTKELTRAVKYQAIESTKGFPLKSAQNRFLVGRIVDHFVRKLYQKKRYLKGYNL